MSEQSTTPETPGPSAMERQLAKSEEEKWKSKYNTAAWKQALAKIDPAALKGEVVGGSLGGDPAAEVEQAYYRGLKMRAVMQGLGSSGQNLLPNGEPANGGQTMVPQTATDKDRMEFISNMTRAGLEAGWKKEDVDDVLSKSAAYVGMMSASSRGNPMAQEMWAGRLFGSSGGDRDKMGWKDMMEMINMIEQRKPQGNDTAALITAMGTFIQAAKEDRGDPASQFSAGMAAMQPIYQQMNEGQKTLTTELLNFYKNQADQNKAKDPLEMLRDIRETAEQMGWASTPESEKIAAMRLEHANEDKKRAHDYKVEESKRAFEAKIEEGKERRQADLIKGITGGLTKALEAPVIRELGKGIGSKIGIKDNPLETAQTSAAQQQVKNLQNPMEATYGFTCQKCHQPKIFTELQMAKIKEAGGKWMCDSPNCGEVYFLKDFAPK